MRMQKCCHMVECSHEHLCRRNNSNNSKVSMSKVTQITLTCRRRVYQQTGCFIPPWIRSAWGPLRNQMLSKARALGTEGKLPWGLRRLLVMDLLLIFNSSTSEVTLLTLRGLLHILSSLILLSFKEDLLRRFSARSIEALCMLSVDLECFLQSFFCLF